MNGMIQINGFTYIVKLLHHMINIIIINIIINL